MQAHPLGIGQPHNVCFCCKLMGHYIFIKKSYASCVTDIEGRNE